MKTRVLGSVTLVVALVALTAPSPEAAQSQTMPTFRARSTLVSVDVSVRQRNAPVPGLAASDFVLTDNGVPQKIEVIDVQTVPVDVSLVVDLSSSTSGRQDGYRSDVARIAGLIRPGDRLRVITFATMVEQALALVPAGTPPSAEAFEITGISSVYDGITAALLRGVEVGRRHLIVAFTDGGDNASIVTYDDLLQAARQSEAVLHLSHADARLTAVAEATGGGNHGGWLSSMPDAFKDIYDGFRLSYVLRYRPEGVPPAGWHDIVVKLTRSGRYDIQARRGYFGDARSPTSEAGRVGGVPTVEIGGFRYHLERFLTCAPDRSSKSAAVHSTMPLRRKPAAPIGWNSVRVSFSVD